MFISTRRRRRRRRGRETTAESLDMINTSEMSKMQKSTISTITATVCETAQSSTPFKTMHNNNNHINNNNNNNNNNNRFNRQITTTTTTINRINIAIIIGALCLALSSDLKLFDKRRLFPLVGAQFEWQKVDSFDTIRDALDAVNGENCKSTDVNRLFLPPGAVSHVPDLQWIGINPVFPNRTNLLQVHNMALSRAFFLSFILQKAADQHEPGLLYYYLSTIADVAANRFVNGSAFYFAPNHAFTPSYRGFYNKTLPLFAPRAYRADDFNDPYHLSRTSTLNTIAATDLGAIANNSQSKNYTTEQYRINEWYNAWLPDLTRRHDSKTTYAAQITHSNGTNETFVWHGPPAPSDPPGPVKWFKPYFDCGNTNKWLYGASVPIPDIYPRHTGWRHIEIPMYVAVAVIEIDYERLDINQCPIGEGNPAPNIFAGSARCRRETTECEPLHGYGLRRGGYQCRCRPGFRLPKTVTYPFRGEQIERATGAEYGSGFGCEKIGYVAVRTQNVLPIDPVDRRKLMQKIETLTGVRANSSTQSRIDPQTLSQFVRAVNAQNCGSMRADLLTLRGDVAYGKEIQFENQARVAVRLAHFLSAFLQVIDPKEQFAEFRVPDKPLTKDQVIGEALAAVIGDQKAVGVAVVFLPRMFSPNDTEFAPYAYKLERNTRKFFVDDLSRFANPSARHYADKDYYRRLAVRWSIVEQEQLEQYTTKIDVRYNSAGFNLIRYDRFPLQYRAAEMRHGYWTAPYFDCGGFHNRWLLTYAVPFFGFDAIKSRIELKGVVAIDIPVQLLDVNQCGMPSAAAGGADSDFVLSSRPTGFGSASGYGSGSGSAWPLENSNNFPIAKFVTSPNAFRNTHKCDRLSTYCVPILGRGFDAGGYKCMCQQGFEYPFNDEITYFDGQIMEAEYGNMQRNKNSRFDTLACRVAAAPVSRAASGPLIAAAAIVAAILIF